MLLKFEEISQDESVQIVRAPVLNPETLLRILVNNFLAVQNLKMALKKANISKPLLQYTTFHNIQKIFRLTLLRVINVRIRVRKNTMENIHPVVDQNRPIRKTQAHDRHSCPISAACQQKNYYPEASGRYMPNLKLLSV